MMTFEEARLRFRVGRVELSSWIERRWLKPQLQGEEWLFDDCDLARLQLIQDLRDLEIGEEALPIVLSLLDQLYAARTTLTRYRELLSTLPEPAFHAVVAAARASKRQ